MLAIHGAVLLPALMAAIRSDSDHPLLTKARADNSAIDLSSDRWSLAVLPAAFTDAAQWLNNTAAATETFNVGWRH